MPEIIKELGKDRKGYEYFLCSDNFVYNRYPTDRDSWRKGHNCKGEFIGYFCSFTSWDNALRKLLVEE